MNAHVLVDDEEYHNELETHNLLFAQSKLEALPINHVVNVTHQVLVSVLTHNSSAVDDMFQNDVGVEIAIISLMKQ